MASIVSNLDLLIDGQGQMFLTANEVFNSGSPSTLFGRRGMACSGLNWFYYGGVIMVDGVLTTIANNAAALVLSASTTNYIEATRAGVVSKNTTGFTPGAIPLYTATTDASTVTSFTDFRPWVQPIDQTSKASVAVTTANVTLSHSEARGKYLTTTGALTGNRNVIVPNDWHGEVLNNCSGAFTLTVKTSGGSGVLVPQGSCVQLYADGTNVVRRSSDSRDGRLVKPMANANVTLTSAEANNSILEVTTSPNFTALRDLIVPIISPRQWIIFANIAGGFGVRVIGATGTGITVADGKRAIVYCDGTNVVRVTADV